MARRCQLTGKEPQFGHNVSHSNRKTNRRFDPNLQKATLYSDALRRKVPLRVCTRVLRTVTRAGGLFLLLVETNHAPTDCEPHRLTPKELLEALKPEFTCESLQVYRPAGSGIYSSIQADQKIPQPEDTTEKGYMSARFVRTTSC